MKDSVGKWYRDKANDLNVIPPHEAWENVEKTMEDWPKHWYQTNFVGIDKDLDTTSWESISQQLEVQRNTKRAKRQFVLRTVSITAAIALIPLWIANVSDGYVKDFSGVGTPQSKVAELELNSESNENPTIVSNNIEGTGNAESSVFTATNGNVSNTSSANPIATAFTAKPNSIAIPSQQVLRTSDSNQPILMAMNSKKPESIKPFGLGEPSLNTRSVAPFSFTLPEEQTTNTDIADNWRVGPTVSVGKSSLINPLSYRDDAMVKSTMNITYGLSVTRKFNRNMFTADLLFNDAKSQNIAMNTEKVNTTMNFVTMSLQYERVLAKIKLTKKFQPELTFGIGAFGSYRTDENCTSNMMNSYYTMFTYKQFDFGGVVNAGISTRLSNHFRFGINGRVQSGALNLFEGRTKIPSDMFKTHTFVTSLQAKLSYTF